MYQSLGADAALQSGNRYNAMSGQLDAQHQQALMQLASQRAQVAAQYQNSLIGSGLA